MTSQSAAEVAQLRKEAAARYPEALIDTKGRHHRCISREAILRGDWDDALLRAKEGRDG